MSRSNPTQNNPHPCTRWFEFSGGEGEVDYYDKEKKTKVIVPIPFTFIWLDETSAIRGWHDPSQSGIMSNEVRDTRSDVMVVKAFKGGELCHGLYSQIRDRVGNLGGRFNTNLYLGYREGNGPLRLGCLQLKGSGLSAWMEFRKTVFKDGTVPGAVVITSTKDGKKGSINFKTPVFSLKEIKPETDEEAKALDVQLQQHLASYFARTKADQVRLPPAAPAGNGHDNAPEPSAEDYEAATPTSNDEPY